MIAFILASPAAVAQTWQAVRDIPGGNVANDAPIKWYPGNGNSLQQFELE